MKHPIGNTRNGIEVFVDLVHSKASKRIARQPHLLGLVEEVVRQKALRDPEIIIEHDMGRTIGYNFVVATSDTDNVFYAQLLRDTIFTRFVKNGKPQSTQFLTLSLRRNDDNTYDLHDVWIGHLSPPRPGSSDETAESKPFWATHAFVLDDQSLQLRSVTKTCPY